MIRNRRHVALMLAALMTAAALAACGKDSAPAGAEASSQTAASSQSAAEQTAGSETSPAADTSDATAASAGEIAGETKLTGALRLIDADDRDPSVLRGLRIIGNSLGTSEDINGKESSLTDVRCIFSLSEWVEFYPDADEDTELRVWILAHRDDQEYYKDCEFSVDMPGFATVCDLHYPADADEPDNWYWGEFYLSNENHEPGYYDMVFTCEDKAIATLLTRFYAEEELNGKTGAELEALMHE